MVSDETANLRRAIDLCCTVGGQRHGEAVAFLLHIAGIARRLDDIQDADHGAVSVADTAHEMLFDLPANAFYRQHGVQILPVMSMALNAWADANAWEPSADAIKRGHALVIRDELTNVALTVARILGGWSHLREISLKVRELFLKPEDWKAGDKPGDGPATETVNNRNDHCVACKQPFKSLGDRHRLDRLAGFYCRGCYERYAKLERGTKHGEQTQI